MKFRAKHNDDLDFPKYTSSDLKGTKFPIVMDAYTDKMEGVSKDERVTIA